MKQFISKLVNWFNTNFNLVVDNINQRENINFWKIFFKVDHMADYILLNCLKSGIVEHEQTSKNIRITRFNNGTSFIHNTTLVIGRFAKDAKELYSYEESYPTISTMSIFKTQLNDFIVKELK